MRKLYKILGLVLTVAFLLSCEDDKEQPAVVSTLEVTEIRTTTAVSGGSIISNGGTPIIESGVCWDSSDEPTIENNITTGGNSESFTSNITQLLPGKEYFVRAYATNSFGTSYGNTISFSTLEYEWLKSADFKGIERESPLSFAYNGKGYYGLGRNSIDPDNENLKDFWTFDPTTSEWTRLNDCPFNFINGLSKKCLIGSNLYVITEYSVYSYNISSDSWEFVCSSSFSLSSTSWFSINNKAYCFEQFGSELYEFIPEEKKFIKKNSIINNFQNYGLDEIFVINNEAYLIHKNDIYVEIFHYLSKSDSWERKLSKEFSNSSFRSASFINTFDDCAYIGQSTSFTVSSFDDNATVVPDDVSSNVWKYDCSKNEFILCNSIPNDFRAGAGCFTINNTGYIIGGVTIDSDTQKFKYLNDVWIMQRE